MIHSPLLYLFIVAIIGTLFAYIKQKSSLKLFSSHLYIAGFIFILTLLLRLLGIFSHTQNIETISQLLAHNLFFAITFLIFIDYHTLLKSSNIGCACTIGPKRYWFLLLLSLFISFLAQFLSLHVSFLNPSFTALLLSALFGVIVSFTPIKNINGIKDIATTMFYLFIASLPQTFP